MSHEAPATLDDVTPLFLSRSDPEETPKVFLQARMDPVPFVKVNKNVFQECKNCRYNMKWRNYHRSFAYEKANIWGTGEGKVKRCGCSLPTKMTQVRCRPGTNVGWVCCCFWPCSEGFSPGFPVNVPPSAKPPSPTSNSTRIVNLASVKTSQSCHGLLSKYLISSEQGDWNFGSSREKSRMIYEESE